MPDQSHTPEEERRHIPRRAEDRELIFRLHSLERLVEQYGLKLDRLDDAIGERYSRLILDLDQRYMPREEMKVVYIPREEHIQRDRHQRAERDKHIGWRLQLPGATLAFVALLITLIDLLTHVH